MDSDWFANRLADLSSKKPCSEADVVSNLVRPALTRVMGFSNSEIYEQAGAKTVAGQWVIPDILCRRTGDSTASVIVEVKNLGTDLIKKKLGGGVILPLYDSYTTT